jgi:hypothetical protein
MRKLMNQRSEPGQGSFRKETFSATAFERTGTLTAAGSYNGIVTILDRQDKILNKYGGRIWN